MDTALRSYLDSLTQHVNALHESDHTDTTWDEHVTRMSRVVGVAELIVRHYSDH
jgi:hypothetical protein